MDTTDTQDAQDAVTQALYLALIAPDDSRAMRAVALADSILHLLTEANIEQAKRDAWQRAQS